MPMCICGCQGRPLIVRGERQNAGLAGETVGAWRCEQCAYVLVDSGCGWDLTEYYQTIYPEFGEILAHLCRADYDLMGSRARIPFEERRAKYGLPVDCSTHEAGCSFGGTVFGLRQAGFDATGTELNSDAIEPSSCWHDGIFAEDAASFEAHGTYRSSSLLVPCAGAHARSGFFLVSIRECLRPTRVQSLRPTASIHPY